MIDLDSVIGILALWKLIEIGIWFFGHFSMNWKYRFNE